MMSSDELAHLALRVLDTQASYFKARDHGILVRSKELEAELRRESQKILNAQEELDFGGKE